MKKLALFALVCATGCRHAHLGPDVGVAFHSAFTAQAESAPAHVPVFGAADANATMAARKPGKTPTTSAPSLIDPMTGGASGGGAAAWPGATGNISLEAK